METSAVRKTALTAHRAQLVWELVRVLQEGLLDAASLPQQLAEALCRRGNFTGVALLLLDSSSTALVGVAHAGISTRYPAGRIPKGRGVSWEAVDKGRPVYVPDLRLDPRVYVPGGFLEEPLSGLFLPLRGRQGPVGVLVVHAPGPDGIPPEDRAFLEEVAAPVALALECAQLYDRMVRAVALLSELLEVTRALAAAELDVAALCQRVVREAVRLVPGAERASLSVREGDEYVFVAAVGYDLEGLRGVRFTEADRLRWVRAGRSFPARGNAPAPERGGGPAPGRGHTARARGPRPWPGTGPSTVSR
jgi:GAF domain-containing protein